MISTTTTPAIPGQRQAGRSVDTGREPVSDRGVRTGAPTPGGGNAGVRSRRLALPRGGQLPAEAFEVRSRILRMVLAVHVVVVAAIGVARHLPVPSLALYVGAAVALGVVGTLATSRTGQASSTSLALLVCAAGLVHATGGSTTAHFDFFVVLAFCAIYQEWIPYLLSVAFVAVHHLVMGVTMPMMVFGEHGLAEHPVRSALIHAVLVLAGCVAGVVSWSLHEASLTELDAARRETERLAADQEAERRENAEHQQRRADDAEARAADVQERAERFRAQADELAGTSTHARTQAALVADSSAGLAASIDEVARTTAEASSVGRGAITDAARLRDEFAALATAAERIRSVVHTVAGMANQTQMLALNASIEAARAGAAGRGFSVVAEEVKALASETSKATVEISGRVEELMRTSSAADQALAGIEAVLGRIELLQTSIAGAASAQSETSAEISAAVADVDRAVAGISDGVSALARAAD